MIKKITEPQKGYVVQYDIIRECLFWTESRYERTAPNDDDWCEYDVYSFKDPFTRFDIWEGRAYKTKEEAIAAHNGHIHRQIKDLQKHLL